MKTVLAALMMIASTSLFAEEPERYRPISHQDYLVLMHFENIGVDVANVNPETLGFSSESFDACSTKVRKVFENKDDLALAMMKCFLRHKAEEPDQPIP